MKITKIFSEGTNDHKSALAQVMAWHQAGAKPLPEPMMIHTYMHHQVSMHYLILRCCCDTGWHIHVLNGACYFIKKLLP